MFSVRITDPDTGRIDYTVPAPLDMCVEARFDFEAAGLQIQIVPVVAGYTFGCDPYNTADSLY